MTQCWPEGELRAYLDRELCTEDMQRVAAHLGNARFVAACAGNWPPGGARFGAAGCAARVERGRAAGGAAGQAARELGGRCRGAGGGLAVAATWCRSAIRGQRAWFPRPRPRRNSVDRRHKPIVCPPVAVAEMTPAPAPRRVRRVRPAAPEPNYFVALDDEPFESGIIMRVDVKPGNLRADIVFGPDGRAHAFRLVSDTQRNF